MPKDSVINNDTVILEAGRKLGSITKSRHATLVEAIELATQETGQNELLAAKQIEQVKSKTIAVKTAHEQLKENYEKLLEKVKLLFLFILFLLNNLTCK